MYKKTNNTKVISRLHLALSCTAVVFTLAVACSIYSSKAITRSFATTTSEVIPELVTVMHLSERSAYLGATAPAMYNAQTEEEVSAATQEIKEILASISVDLEQLVAKQNLSKVIEVKSKIYAVVDNLNTLELKIRDKLALRAEVAFLRQKVENLRFDLQDSLDEVNKQALELYNSSIEKVNSLYKSSPDKALSSLTHKQEVLIESVNAINNYIQALQQFSPGNVAACGRSYAAINSKFAELQKIEMNISPELRVTINEIAGNNMCKVLYLADHPEMIELSKPIKTLNEAIYGITLLQKHNLTFLNSATNNVNNKVGLSIENKLNTLILVQKLSNQGNNMLEYLTALLTARDEETLEELENKLSVTVAGFSDLVAKLRHTDPALARQLSENALISFIGTKAVNQIKAQQVALNVEIRDLVQSNKNILVQINHTLENTTEAIINNAKGQHLALTVNSNMVQIGVIFSAVAGILAIILAARYAAKVLRGNDSKFLKLNSLLNKQKREKVGLLRTIKHDIRGPVHAIVALAAGIFNTTNKEEQAKLLKHLMSSADYLLRTTNNILAYARLDFNTLGLQMAPFNPKTLVTTLVNTHHQAAKNKGLTLEQEINYDLDLQLLGDSSKIQQVLFHLINNAIKFTPSGKIVVSLDAAETSNNVVMLKLVVRDTGVGISKQQREHLCKPFYSNSEELQSPGLGLAICARLVRLMGGKLQLNSKLNYGSVFSIKIPLQISDIKLNSPVKEVTNEHIHINTQDFNVLLIDNNEVNHAIIQYGLTNLGYNIHCMKNTSAVFNMLKEERVDIILFDTAKARNMLEQIQEMKDIIGDIPMIAMSDDLELENRANYVQYGITEFITRPISINQVHKTIAQQLQHKTKTQTAQVFEINTFA